jgi:FlaA1/EpsC-like NDP-sugar epimerase
MLRFEGDLPADFADALLWYLPWVLGIKLFVLAGMGQFKAMWRYVTELRMLLPWEWAHELVLPVGVIIFDLVLCFLGLIGARAMVRLVSENRERRRIDKIVGARVPTLLYGAGRAGAMVAKEILARPDSDIQLIGFLDDDKRLFGMNVEGLPVLGCACYLDRLIESHRVRQVIITIANGQEDAAPRIARICEKAGLQTKVIPPLHEIVAGQINLNKLREVSIEDLLRRKAVRLDLSEIEKIVRNQVVLVTGAGGSIGSELCRIVAKLRPATLVLVEQAENSLFHVHNSLIETFPDLHVVPCIADICDERRMDAIFAEWRPPLVFHAAAHKHVPMMEWNPGEAVKNNILGTKTIATLADAWQVERFVMISTDKAVNPTSVMGVSKRVAELFIQSFGQKSTTNFMTVRFGNVLGSAGSVIPTFQRQIAAGGPVTVTHPEMQRYFMTIPEACQLVLQAAAMGKGGELFILDMGQPVKIVDLARDLIRLSGLVPDVDVEVRFTGLRPGEKLFEELSLGEEDTMKTRHPRIFIGKVKAANFHWLSNLIDDLEESAMMHDVHRIFGKLKEVVPEYQGGHIRQDVVKSIPAIAEPHKSHDSQVATLSS